MAGQGLKLFDNVANSKVQGQIIKATPHHNDSIKLEGAVISIHLLSAHILYPSY
jgi:hypothetical protein